MKCTVPPPGRIQEVRACLGPGEGPHVITARRRRLNDAGRSGKVREQGGEMKRGKEEGAEEDIQFGPRLALENSGERSSHKERSFRGGGYVREERQRFGVGECWV